MLEIPEYMTFKDGDVIGFVNGCVGIFKSIDINKKIFSSYTTLLGFKLSFYETGWNLTGSHKATEEEKQKLFYALNESKEPKAKELLERFFQNHSNSSKIGKDCEFKPFDKVLVRDNYSEKWSINFFSHMKNEDEYYYCLSQYWKQCIPYNDQTAHLLGTTENYE